MFPHRPSSIIYKMAESPYPPSFNGSGWGYGFALFSLMLIALVGFYTVSVAARNIAANRGTSTSWEHVLALMAAVGASGRCVADTVYKMAWGEVNAETLTVLLTVKNVIDALICIPVIGWMLLYHLRVSTVDRNRYKAVRLSISIGLVAIVAAIFAFSKV